MNQIKHILDRVRSLEDLSADDIAELRCVSQSLLLSISLRSPLHSTGTGWEKLAMMVWNSMPRINALS